MRYLLRLERIGDDATAFLRSVGARSAVSAAWVAQLTGPDPERGFARTFLRGSRDYRRANKVGSRGVVDCYLLDDGIYEVSSPVSWHRTHRYFLRVTDGQPFPIDRQEAERLVMLQVAPSATAPDPPPPPRQKVGLGIDVLSAARQRIARLFDDFPRLYVSFSGGKDSTVLLHLALDEAQRRHRRIGVLFVDLEAQYRLTIEHVQAMYERYADHIEPYWLALPISLRNAVSQYEPQWQCWQPDRRAEWVREPPGMAIVDESIFPFFRRGMEFEELVPAFGHWYARGEATACLVGIRADESLNRWRTVANTSKLCHDGLRWTTWLGDGLYNAYPIYDWRTEDIWIYHGQHPDRPYNRLYDRMHRAGLTIHQARICQPYGDDQRRGLWLYHVIEPETWGRVVSRVSGANQGALYVQESGNILGQRTLSKPDGHTWQSFAELLLASLPPQTRDHYENKIATFLHWYRDRGYPNGIPDDGSLTDKTVPSWARICKALLRNDYWCKGLSFSQHKSDAYARYQRVMQARRARWGLI